MNRTAFPVLRDSSMNGDWLITVWVVSDTEVGHICEFMGFVLDDRLEQAVRLASPFVSDYSHVEIFKLTKPIGKEISSPCYFTGPEFEWCKKKERTMAKYVIADLKKLYKLF